MTVELAWRRRKRERAERALADRRHEEVLRVTIAAAVVMAPHSPVLNGVGVHARGELRTPFIDAVLADVKVSR